MRLYVELDKLGADERVADRNITLDQLIAAAQRILHPYTLDVKEVRVVVGLRDRPAHLRQVRRRAGGRGGARLPHVFIAGDACHTHSPKAGQGMNVSMQDAFNLGWKLAAVLRGRAHRSCCTAIPTERQAIAQELIDFDREWAKMFSARPQGRRRTTPRASIRTSSRRYFVRHGRFTAGTATRYRPSVI